MVSIEIQRIVLHLVLAAICVFIESSCAKCTSSTVTIVCVENRLVVTGDSICIAEIIKTAPCWSDSEQIDIFALNKVIFDDDIDKRGQNVNITIFSPTWEIIPIIIIKKHHDTYKQLRYIRFNTSTEFNFFGMSMDKINRGYLKFSFDGDEKQIKMMVNNGEFNCY